MHLKYSEWLLIFYVFNLSFYVHRLDKSIEPCRPDLFTYVIDISGFKRVIIKFTSKFENTFHKYFLNEKFWPRKFLYQKRLSLA